MLKTRSIFRINAAISILAITCIAISSKTEEVPFMSTLYNISVSLLSGTTAALVLCAYDYVCDYNAFLSLLAEYKKGILDLLPNDNRPLSSDEIEQLRMLCLEYRIPLSKYRSDKKCDDLQQAVVKCINNPNEEYIRLLRQEALNSNYV